jgi:integrase
MRWSEINTQTWTWTLPAERSKNKRAHAVPLSLQAREIIETAPRISEFVFGGRSGANHFNRAKTALDDLVRFTQPWVLHDIRRSAASGLQRLGVRTEVIERALNHVSGVYRSVAGIYQRDPLIEEVRDALARWGNHVEHIASGKPLDNVLRLRGA